MEVRTGKTLTALGIARACGFRNVVFITKKKAISSIQSDYNLLAPNYKFNVINYESMHKLDITRCDFLILDEAHGMGAFPKPSKRAKDVKEFIKKHSCAVCLLSGTPTPESYSQMYHQVYGIPTNPFNQFRNFYDFASQFVKVSRKKINSMYINDYSNGLMSIVRAMQPYTISYTQKEAGFVNEINEEILFVEMKPNTYRIAKKLKRDSVVEGAEQVILGDTPAKMLQKLHQIYSGTIIFESGESMVLDKSKAEFIKYHFKGKKIGIFYKFKQELKVLKEVFGKENLTTELEEFDNTNKSIALQIVSGREGISLRKADALVYYNIDFSATSYWQSRDRMTTKFRKNSKVYWIFSDEGIEKDIYKTVIKKKDYTVNHFKKDLLSL
ncbi:MAG: SNF2-related protein [Candidatus Thorarchaeota archaeon]